MKWPGLSFCVEKCGKFSKNGFPLQLLSFPITGDELGWCRYHHGYKPMEFMTCRQEIAPGLCLSGPEQGRKYSGACPVRQRVLSPETDLSLHEFLLSELSRRSVSLQVPAPQSFVCSIVVVTLLESSLGMGHRLKSHEASHTYSAHACFRRVT